MRRASLYLCLVAAVFVLLASCTRAPVSVKVEGDVRSVHPIMIHIVNDRIMIDPRVVPLRCPDDQAAWGTTPPGLKFEVRFDKKEGTPFERDQFDNTHYLSGPPKSKVCDDAAESDQYFPYTVEVEGYGEVDPGVIIW